MVDWMPRSFSDGANKFLAENTQEYDYEAREAVFYLFTSPIKGRNDEETERRHWALVVEFVDGSIRRIEGNELKGYLMGYYYKDSPRVKGKYFELVKLNISPLELRNAAVRNELNYQEYSFSTRSCQHWVQEFAQQLGNKDLIEKLSDYKSLDESNPVFALTAHFSCGILRSVCSQLDSC